MKAEDVKIGMKVVPHSKSYMPTTESFNDFLKTREGKFLEENGYLFVSNISDCNTRFGLQTNPTEPVSWGFRAYDFEPYIETPKKVQIAFVTHEPYGKQFLFAVPNGLTVKTLDKVLCATAQGESEGTVCGVYPLPDDTKALEHATGAYFPLKSIIGKYKLIKSDKEG